VSRWKSRGSLEKFAGDVKAMALRDRLAGLLDGRGQHEHLTPV